MPAPVRSSARGLRAGDPLPRPLSRPPSAAARPFEVVRGLDLTVERGEFVGLVGESGSGKSLTALAILGLVPPPGEVVAGRIRLDGRDLLGLAESEMRTIRGGRIGLVFQEPMAALNPVLTLETQICEAVQAHRKSGARVRSGAARARALELLELLAIPDPVRRLREYPHQLSGGQRQRAMLAIALAAGPELLIADEPTTALDVTLQAQVLELLARLRRELGLAILLITHDLAVVAESCDRVLVMYAGEIVEAAAAERLFARPAHPYARGLLASIPVLGQPAPRGEMPAIPGQVPAADGLPPGCVFAPRCADADRALRGRTPALGRAGRRARRPLSAAPRPAARRERRMSALLEVRGLAKEFPIRSPWLRRRLGAVAAVAGVDLDIAAGETVALVGESGSGKSTLGRMIVRLIEPTRGTIRFRGEDLLALAGRDLRRARRHFQVVFQDPYGSLNPRLRIGDALFEPLLVHGLADRRDRGRAGRRAARRGRHAC